MKSFSSFYAILMVFVIFPSCSSNDDNNSNEYIEHYEYKVTLSDDCDCYYADIPFCWFCVEITKEEYLRLLDIQENSSDPCVYVYIASEAANPNQYFYWGPEGQIEGYLLNLDEGPCVECCGNIGPPI